MFQVFQLFQVCNLTYRTKMRGLKFSKLLIYIYILFKKIIKIVVCSNVPRKIEDIDLRAVFLVLGCISSHFIRRWLKSLLDLQNCKIFGHYLKTLEHWNKLRKSMISLSKTCSKSSYALGTRLELGTKSNRAIA